MLRGFLSLFTTEEKVDTMLSHSIIEFIFIGLFTLFFITIFIHLILFMRLGRVRQHIKQTGELTIEPTQTFYEQFLAQQETDTVHLDTFVQERFSSWRMFHIPVINLIKFTKMTVSVFILLGVLGTFIGLTISLGSMNMATEQLVENISTVMSGIDVAFYTSIIGMSFSLMMTVLLKVMNTESMLTDIMLMTEMKLAEKSKQGIPKLIEVSETINESIGNLQITHEKSLAGIINAFSGFKHYTDGLIQAAKDLSSFNEGLSKNLEQFQQLFDHMETVTSRFEQGTDVLNNNFTKLFSYIDNAEANQKRSLTLFEQTYENITSANELQTASIEQVSSTVSTLQTFSENLLAEQIDVKRAMESMNEESASFVKNLAKHNERFSQIFGHNLHEKMSEMSNEVRKLATHFNRMGDTFVQLPKSLDAIYETQSEFRTLLTDRFSDIEQFNESFRDHLMRHRDDVENFASVLRDTTKSFDQMSTRNYELLHELNRTAENLERGHETNEQQIETMVHMLQDALTQYVSNVERTLQERLENIAREIAHSMQSLNHDVKRDIQDIHQLTEHGQRLQVEGMQRLYENVGRELQHMLQEVARAMNRTTNVRPRNNQPISVNHNEGWHNYDR